MDSFTYSVGADVYNETKKYGDPKKFELSKQVFINTNHEFKHDGKKVSYGKQC